MMKLKKIRKLIPSYARDRIRVIQYQKHEVKGFWLSNDKKFSKYKDYQIVEITPFTSGDGVSLIGVTIQSDEIATVA